MSAMRDFAQFFVAEGPRLRRFLKRFGPAVSASVISASNAAMIS